MILFPCLFGLYLAVGCPGEIAKFDGIHQREITFSTKTSSHQDTSLGAADDGTISQDSDTDLIQWK